MDDGSTKLSSKATTLLTCLGIVVVVGLFALTSATVRVKYGTVGVITRFGKVTDRILYPGFHWKVPFVDKALTYNTKKVTYETSEHPEESEATYTDFPVDTTTQDGQQITVRYTVRFSVNPDRIQWIANNIGTENDLVEKIVKTDSRIFARNIPREFNAEELYTGNVAEVSTQIEETLRPNFKANGLVLDEFGIRQISFQQDYVDTIEAKQIEKEKVKTEQHIAEQEKFKKEQAITKAEAEAKAQELQQETLTQFLLDKMRLEKWNGEYPDYLVITGNNESFILPMPQGTQE